MKKILLLLPLLFFACADKKSNEQPETILARVGDKTISVNEFLRRAEYTIRPVYCRGDNYIHQKIVLNSLIAEKLLALEAEGDPVLDNNDEFQDYLIGRKEQAMRQWLHNEEAFEKAAVDTNEVKQYFKLAGRTYTIAYMTMQDSALVEQAKRELANSEVSFDEISRKLGGTLSPPQREVSFNTAENADVIQALYSQKLEKNQVVGPIVSEDNQHTFIKILGWNDRVVLSDQDINRRWQDTKSWLKQKKAHTLYSNYIRDLMQGKKIEFMEQTFRQLVNLAGPYYMQSEDDKKAAFNKNFWQDDQNEIDFENLGSEIDKLSAMPLFRIDGEIWTVQDFEMEMRRHPLVFRKRKFSQKEFAEQFKLAIVDMVRDRYVTEDAYKKGYDKVPVVQRNYTMWRDNLYALYAQNKYLQSIGKMEAFSTNALNVIESDLNPLVDSLQARNDDRIVINTDVFEKLKLSRVDMMAIQRNVPFPIVVPNFPVVTSDNRLDYGRKMEKSAQ